MSEQIDIAVDLGAVPQPLPEIVSFRDFVVNPPTPPPQVIEGDSVSFSPRARRIPVLFASVTLFDRGVFDAGQS